MVQYIECGLDDRSLLSELMLCERIHDKQEGMDMMNHEVERRCTAIHQVSNEGAPMQ